jgi:hypothetical protein
MPWLRAISQAVGHRRGAQSRVQAVFGSGGESVLRPARRRARVLSVTSTEPGVCRQIRALGRNVWLTGDPDRMCWAGAGCTECPADDVAGSVSSRHRWGRSQRQSLRAMMSWLSTGSRVLTAEGHAGRDRSREPSMRRADHAESRACGERAVRGAGRGGPDRPAWPRQACPPAGTGRVVLKGKIAPRPRQPRGKAPLNLASGMCADRPTVAVYDIPKLAKLSRKARNRRYLSVNSPVWLTSLPGLDPRLRPSCPARTAAIWRTHPGASLQL